MVLLARSSKLSGRIESDAPAVETTPWLSTLTYRSRAVVPMADLELHRLLRTAQARNRAEGITGIVVYDRGFFYQWLEGPADGLARIWDSVQRDPRHTAVEMLGNQPTRQRFFGDWDLKLSIRSTRAFDAEIGAIDIPEALAEDLVRRPEATPTLLARLAPTPLMLAPSLPLAADERQRTALLEVVEQLVIPRLVSRHVGKGPALGLGHPRAAELARLLIATEPEAASALVVQLHAAAGSLTELVAQVVEPTARRLGDLWLADDCSELELTLALCRLQSDLRGLSLGATRSRLLGLPAVLVVPQPGEAHGLGAALDAELLWRAGWDMHAEFPASDGALDALLAGTWFDALDLSLSAALRHEHGLPRLAETIAHARSASLNPALVVVVGGRVFAEPGDAALQVGADASCISAAQIESVIRQVLPRGRLSLLP
jgi:methanogenic corrinoid protein MtbC1